jgi:hypothetical protein
VARVKDNGTSGALENTRYYDFGIHPDVGWRIRLFKSNPDTFIIGGSIAFTTDWIHPKMQDDDFFLIKVDGNLNFGPYYFFYYWTYYSESIRSIKVLPDYSIIAAGPYYNGTDFDPFIARVDGSFGYRWWADVGYSGPSDDCYY